MTSVDFSVPYLEFSSNVGIENSGKSIVVFGSNGIGKSSIYNSIKNNNPNYAYIDYSDMRSSFISGKAKEINITPYAHQYHDLSQKKKILTESIDPTQSLKRFDIYAAAKVKAVAPTLTDIKQAKVINRIITIDESMHNKLSKELDKT